MRKALPCLALSWLLGSCALAAPGSAVPGTGPPSQLPTPSAAPEPVAGLNVYGGTATSMNVSRVPGRIDRDYHYMNLESLRYLKSQGVRHIRTSFLLERVESAQGIAEISAYLERVRSQGMSVTIVMGNHNARWIKGNQETLGSGWRIDDWVSSWVSIASLPIIKNRADVSLDLLNEPSEPLSAELWERASSKCVQALRAAGIGNRIKVEPFGAQSLRYIDTYHPRGWWIRDPIQETIVSPHYYPDRGSWLDPVANSWAEQNKSAKQVGYADSFDETRTDVSRFIKWLNQQPDLSAAEVGEIGWGHHPNASESRRFQALGELALKSLRLSKKPIRFDIFGSSDWQSPQERLSPYGVLPNRRVLGTRNPQAPVIEPYLGMMDGGAVRPSPRSPSAGP